MKKVLFYITLFVMTMVVMPNVYAAETVDKATNASDLTNLLSQGKPVIELEKDGNYDGAYTITKDVKIIGNGATIKGSIKITGGNSVNISNLTMTDVEYGKGTAPYYDNAYIEVASTTDKVDLKLSNVTIYTGTKDKSSSFITAGTGVKVSLNVAKGSTVTIENSTIQTKYAVWMYGGDCDLYVTDSELSGYAALDLTSNSNGTENNKVTVDNSTLTGYAIGSSTDSNDYGTIVVGNKKNVTIDITNGSKITNNFENGKGARSDLILINDPASETTIENVTIDVVDSELINTAEEVDLGAIYNANAKEGSSFKTENTKVEGTLIANALEGDFYVDFVVDGKSNVVLAKDGKLDPKDIPTASKKGYTFDGWLDENDKPFDTKTTVTANITVTAKFTKIPASEKNPATRDNLLTYVSLSTIALIGALGTGLYLKKVNE